MKLNNDTTLNDMGINSLNDMGINSLHKNNNCLTHSSLNVIEEQMVFLLLKICYSGNQTTNMKL